jgi:hypothetical protein
MKTRVNLKNIEKTKVFSKYIYPVFAREFLFGSDYDLFALHIGRYFILTPEQWECILIEWEDKEQILSD